MYSYLSPRKFKIFLVALLVLLVVLFGFFEAEVKNFFYSKSESTQKILWDSGSKTSEFLKRIFRTEIINEENKKLREENQKLLYQIALLKDFEKENKILREALDLGFQKEFKLKLADVLIKDIFRDIIIIDKGLQDGIREGMPVITQERVLVGKVGEVENNFSRVVLISDPSNSFPAKLKENVVGVVKGKGNLELLLEKIPREVDVKEGDIVTTVYWGEIFPKASLGEIFPKNLLVGKINEVKKTDISPFQEIKASVFFDISELKKVFVITRY